MIIFNNYVKIEGKQNHQIDKCVRSLQAKYNLSNSNKKLID